MVFKVAVFLTEMAIRGKYEDPFIILNEDTDKKRRISIFDNAVKNQGIWSIYSIPTFEAETFDGEDEDMMRKRTSLDVNEEAQRRGANVVFQMYNVWVFYAIDFSALSLRGR